jgi:hypothetical protein
MNNYENISCRYGLHSTQPVVNSNKHINHCLGMMQVKTWKSTSQATPHMGQPHNLHTAYRYRTSTVSQANTPHTMEEPLAEAGKYFRCGGVDK